jgi:hypothetical protein
LRDSGFTEEELIEQQKQLFAKAKSALAQNNANNNTNNTNTDILTPPNNSNYLAPVIPNNIPPLSANANVVIPSHLSNSNSNNAFPK